MIPKIFYILYRLSVSLYRRLRIFFKKLSGYEPNIRIHNHRNLVYFGNYGYGGWAIPYEVISCDSVVVDVGLGEDISFSESLLKEYQCVIHGFDPTPRAIEFVRGKALDNFFLYEFGLAGSNRKAKFFLPNNQDHVSGSVAKCNHVGDCSIEVRVIDIYSLMSIIGVDHIDLLKIDIEGAEYELLMSAPFSESARHIRILCIEFHHRWKEFGVDSTRKAVTILSELGFECVWQSRETNEEFTFLNTRFIVPR